MITSVGTITKNKSAMGQPIVELFIGREPCNFCLENMQAIPSDAPNIGLFAVSSPQDQFCKWIGVSIEDAIDRLDFD